MKFEWLHQFDLRHDQDEASAIDAKIRNGIRIGGTNLWVLIFAILIASIGLNVNSTAVIIGAMLISPLMGPIIGIGYGAGVNDFELIKRSFKSLSLFVLISIATATFYFLASPLSQAQSELLARTTPSLWDVLIAFFGGAAGIVALTRKDVSTVVPGVAIATALMPPLCTAGYGIANGNLDYFAGSFFLFSINSVFIAFATILFVKVLKLPQRAVIDEGLRQRNRILIGVAVLITLIPSTYLAYRLVQQELFSKTATLIVNDIDHDNRFMLLGKTISANDRSVILTFGGTDAPPASLKHEIETRFAGAGVPGTRVTVRYAGAGKFDVSSLRQELQQNLYSNTLQQLEEKIARIHVLEVENAGFRSGQSANAQLLGEIQAQYPEASQLVVAQGVQSNSSGIQKKKVIIVSMLMDRPLSIDNQMRMKAWLKVRFPEMEIQLLVRGSTETGAHKRTTSKR